MNKAKEKTFESQARMLIGAARNASIENPSKICYALSELSNYVNKDISGYSGSVLLDKENKVNKIWLSKEPYIINGSIEEEIEVIELEQYQEASATCEDIEILACSEDPSSYTLVISPDGGIHDGHENNEGYELTKNGTKTITEPTKFGYVFDGWEIVTGEPGSFVDELFVMGEENVVIRAKWVSLFTYTGTYSWLDDGDGNWRIKFLTSGTFTPAQTVTIDIFCVGGGGGSGCSTCRGGGGGGYTKTSSSVVVQSGIGYPVVVGAGGSVGLSGGNSYMGSSSLYYANGGGAGSSENHNGGSGGSGGGGGGSGSVIAGSGGTNGGNGASPSGIGGLGQGSTTREFEEMSGTLYAGGGGGSPGVGGTVGSGGQGGGGNGSGGSGATNTGGGGGGTGGAGGSGIVVIRNHR